MTFEESLRPYLKGRSFGLSDEQQSRVVAFAGLLYAENERQNLTRIEGVEEFVDGHLIDVLKLFQMNALGNRVCDIGSGSGVPGLLAACIDEFPREWLLVESEAHKAEYLLATAAVLGLKRVQVYSARIESAVTEIAPDTIIARAVGPVDRIAAWIWHCSTWNNLILFKSRGWEAEWERARMTKFGKKLTVTQTHEYSINDKYRVLVKLTRS